LVDLAVLPIENILSQQLLLYWINHFIEKQMLFYIQHTCISNVLPLNVAQVTHLSCTTDGTIYFL